ncbi:MAG: hypothetical protein IPM35_04710 [Myxococcales bacterium]|nr:hypothetical protein [Myxococcales bacterium]
MTGHLRVRGGGAGRVWGPSFGGRPTTGAPALPGDDAGDQRAEVRPRDAHVRDKRLPIKLSNRAKVSGALSCGGVVDRRRPA